MKLSKAQLEPFQLYLRNKFKITKRECEVWSLISLGYGQKRMMYELKLSLNTIKTHTRLMYRKLKIVTDNNNGKKEIAKQLFESEWSEYEALKKKNVCECVKHKLISNYL